MDWLLMDIWSSSYDENDQISWLVGGNHLRLD